MFVKQSLRNQYRFFQLFFFLSQKSYIYQIWQLSQYVVAKAKKKKNVFPLTLPTLIFCAYPKVFLAIFEQALLKSECVPYRN